MKGWRSEEESGDEEESEDDEEESEDNKESEDDKAGSRRSRVRGLLSDTESSDTESSDSEDDLFVGGSRLGDGLGKRSWARSQRSSGSAKRVRPCF
jgi:hypothetical protein